MALPFRLPYRYIMNGDAIDDEFLNPTSFKETLLNLGLQKVELDTEEFFLSTTFVLKYNKLSRHDASALAIAKKRRITLLTGDKRLRDAAKKEGVNVIGTLGLLDRLYTNDYIEEEEYDECLRAFKKHNGAQIRLPEAEIERRLKRENEPFIKHSIRIDT